MYLITKEFRFEAAHHLNKVPKGHKCARPHGHSYKFTLILVSDDLDERGFVVDYTDISAAVKPFIDSTLDHYNLNSTLPQLAGDPDFETTAENIARLLYETFKPTFPQLEAVEVRETESSSATYGVRE